jgi:hypothetical protein
MKMGKPVGICGDVLANALEDDERILECNRKKEER